METSRTGSGMSHRSRGRRSSRETVKGPAWTRFRADVADLRERYTKRTSLAHKRFVLGFILAGAALRFWLVLQPITAAEATASVTFGSGSFSAAISDYSLPINHILHTVLAMCSTDLFGHNVIALRMPAFLAGVLVLPLYYLFVRSLFNRYIALTALALVAAFPGLIELSALAHGYSITWCCLLFALIMGRYLVRSNNVIAAVLMGLACAFGLWAVPSMLPVLLLVHLWVLFSLLGKYDRSMGDRLGKLGASLLVSFVLAFLLYLPVIMSHGMDQLFNHVTEEERTWKHLAATYADKVADLWMWVMDPSYWWVALVAMLGQVFSAYTSAKYRALLFAVALGALPVALLFADPGLPQEWAYVFFILHIGTAIAVFYLLKMFQDRLFPKLTKRTRTTWAAVVLFVGFAIPGLEVVRIRAGHLPEAAAAAELLSSAMVSGDRLCVDPLWEPPLFFELMHQGMPPRTLAGTPTKGASLFVVLAKPHGSSEEMVMVRCGQPKELFGTAVSVREWPRMEIFAAPLR